MADIEKLRADHEKAEEKMHRLQGERDAARAKLVERFDQPLRDAQDAAAAAQKALCDAEAAQALADRDDIDDDTRQGLADSLGLTLP